VTLPDLWTEAEAAERLKVCARTLRTERKAGRLTYVLMRGCIRYTSDDLLAYIEGNRQCPSINEKAHHSGGIRSQSRVFDIEEARKELRNARPQ